MKSSIAISVVFAAAVFLAGCGREEKAEAVRLADVLKQKQSDYAKADAAEKEFVDSARAWLGGITASGSGKGAALQQNATVATELAKSAVAVSGELGKVRQAVAELTLTKEFPKSVRNELVERLTRRQRVLQDLRALLEKSAPQFIEFGRDRSYAGDSYPGEIGKLDATLAAYKTPDDAVGLALNALNTEYGLGNAR